MENNGFNKHPVQGFYQKPQSKPTAVAEQEPAVNSSPLVTPTPVASPIAIVNSAPVVEPVSVDDQTPSFNPTPIVTPSASLDPAPVVEATPVVDQVEQIQKLTEEFDAPVAEETNRQTAVVSQLQLTAFFTCTKRYENILQAFPNEFRCGTVAFNQDVHIAKIKGVKESELAVIRLFNLFSEEFYLEGIGALPSGIWEIWREQMTSLFRTKLLREAWQKLKDDFASQAEFQQFVDLTIDSE